MNDDLKLVMMDHTVEDFVANLRDDLEHFREQQAANAPGERLTYSQWLDRWHAFDPFEGSENPG